MLRTRHNRWNRNESFQRQKDKDKGYVRNVDVARVIFKDENLKINPFDFIFDLANTTNGRDFRLERFIGIFRWNFIFIFIGKKGIKRIKRKVHLQI